MPLAPGTRLGSYEILAPVGAGGMGEVYRARDTRLGREVAVKVLPPAFAQDAASMQRFAREARVLASLNHPNIAAIYGVEEQALVMEFVEGPTLADRIQQRALPLEEALSIAKQIAEAVEYAHNRGVIHRDLKPANIKIAPGRRVKLLDFGLAKTRAAVSSSPDETRSLELTQQGTIAGTPQYMSPEQVEGKIADERSDIWAFGAVLYEMLTGKRAFSAGSLQGIIAAVLRDQPIQVSRVRPDVSARFDFLVATCLEKDPGRRFASMRELKTALERMPVNADTRASIAVLPFANLSAEKENEYFGDGLAEEIINALTQLSGIRVIARTSAFVFKTRQEDVRRIAEILGVANVLQGSVRKAGSRMRVTAQLVTGADATQVWSNRYDREVTDVFAVQDEIARAVVDALRNCLGVQVAKQIVQRQTADIEAYHLYVRGRHYFYKLEPADMDMGRRLFEEALGVDPNYAVPYVDLAHYYWVNTMTRRISPAEGTKRGLEAAERALDLDNTLGEAAGFRARFRALYEYRWAEAVKDLERAMEMNPASALTPQGYAVVLTALNQLDDAIHRHEHALKADPFSLVNQYFMARLLVCLGDYDRAGEHARQAVNIAADSWLANGALGLVHLCAGRISEAIRSLEKAADSSPAGFITTGWRGCAYVLAGQIEKADRLLQDLEQMASPFPAAMIHAQLGNTSAAFDQLEAAVRGRDFLLYNVQVESAFNHLRSDARYENVLRLMKLRA